MQKIAKNKGFTLIEILVVIGIIAVLAAIVLVALNPARQFALARQSERSSNTNAVLNAIGQYIADNQGDLPTDLTAGMARTPIEGSVANLPNLCNDLVPEYMPALATDPKSGFDDIVEVDCGSYVDTLYELEVDSNNRVTVCAPESLSEPTITGVSEICVTR